MTTERTPYVMFGHSRVLGDHVQLIDLLGGVLTTVVQNVPDAPRPGSPTLAERLARFRDPEWNPHGVNDRGTPSAPSHDRRWRSPPAAGQTTCRHSAGSPCGGLPPHGSRALHAMGKDPVGFARPL